MVRLLFLIALSVVHQSSFAALYKCKTDSGKTAYQDAPCAGAKQSTLPLSSSSDLSTVNKKSFSGAKMSLNFQNAPVATVLQVIADFSGYKINVAPSVTQSGSFHYMNQPWDAVLADIAANYKLSVVVQSGEIKVGPR